MKIRKAYLSISAAAAIAAASAVALTPAPAGAGEIKLAHFMSPKHPMDRFIMRPWSEEIAKLSGGSLTVRIYPGGALGKGPVAQFKRRHSVERHGDIDGR